ncbi:hypothetical protein OY671_008713, partial [Metschnikowia pulcherrima]
AAVIGFGGGYRHAAGARGFGQRVHCPSAVDAGGDDRADAVYAAALGETDDAGHRLAGNSPEHEDVAVGHAHVVGIGDHRHLGRPRDSGNGDDVFGQQRPEDQAVAVENGLAEKTVSISRESDTDKYDPHRTTARGAAEVSFMAADTMVGSDYDMKTPVPALAKSWTISPDGSTYTFHSQDNVKWHDGKPFTADDVVFTSADMSPKTHARARVISNKFVDSVQAPDPKTVVIKSKSPFPAFMS